MSLFHPKPYKKSVMFAAHFANNRTGYFVILDHGGPQDDYLVLPIARKRQETGDLPKGEILTVRRVR